MRFEYFFVLILHLQFFKHRQALQNVNKFFLHHPCCQEDGFNSDDPGGIRDHQVPTATFAKLQIFCFVNAFLAVLPFLHENFACSLLCWAQSLATGNFHPVLLELERWCNLV